MKIIILQISSGEARQAKVEKQCIHSAVEQILLHIRNHGIERCRGFRKHY